MNEASVIPRLQAIVDVDVAARAGWTPVDLAAAVLAGGARLLQVRAKRLPSAAFLELTDRIVALAKPHQARVVVNDRVDVARMAGADGVHVGQDDLPPNGVREQLGPDALIGYSTHTVAQIEAALLEPIGYVAVGPVFGTTTKDTGYAAAGLALVTAAAQRAGNTPVVAIGGITLATAASVIDAGASSVAVISDLLSGGDPVARTQAFLQRLARGKPRIGTRA